MMYNKETFQTKDRREEEWVKHNQDSTDAEEEERDEVDSRLLGKKIERQQYRQFKHRIVQIRLHPFPPEITSSL